MTHEAVVGDGAAFGVAEVVEEVLARLVAPVLRNVEEPVEPFACPDVV